MSNATTTNPSPATTGGFSRATLIGGGLGLVALGALATALVLQAPKKQAADEAPAAVSTAPVATTAPAKAPPKKAESGAKDSRPATTPLDTQPAVAAACATCGIVESVTPVQHKGEGTGLGAVAGGVVGGVVGHQMGGGTGKQAMTVLGAIGGGLAGHEIEKRARSMTAYQVKIRMADGSTRTVTQAQSLPVGQHVHVDGGKVTPVADDGNAAAGGTRTLQTSART